MSPQQSNRQALLEGAIQCLEESPSAKITARQIAAAAQANLRSIGYHFGSTDQLLAQAMMEGFRRWLLELVAAMGDVSDMDPVERIQHAGEILVDGMRHRTGLVHAFLTAVASAPHNSDLRLMLAESYRDSRATVAGLLGLGDDRAARHAASLVLATFDGLLVQAVVDPDDVPNAAEMQDGIERLTEISQRQEP